VGEAAHSAAYEDLLRRYLAPLRRLAWSYARDGFEDLFQEIAIALWKGLPGFRGDCSERTWVYRVAHNTAITFVTRDRKRDARERPVDAAGDPASAQASPEGAAIDAQRRARLQAAVDELPVSDKQVVLLYLEGLSAAEIEGVTGISAGAVATRLTRLRQKLSLQVRGEESV
jgi:RNA polymerase sigma-70 factor (ECF subfamily)